MNDIYFRFFRVTEGPLVDEFQRIEAHNELAYAEWRTLTADLGAVDFYHWRNGGVACFCFKDNPDPKHWRSNESGYLPKKNTKIGREIWKRIDQILIIKSASDYALRAANLDPDFSGMIDGNRSYNNVMGWAHGVYFVKVPWRDVPAAEMVAYKQDEKRFNAGMKHLQWVPPAEFTEIKEWQFLKELEELTGEDKEQAA